MQQSRRHRMCVLVRRKHPGKDREPAQRGCERAGGGSAAGEQLAPPCQRRGVLLRRAVRVAGDRGERSACESGRADREAPGGERFMHACHGASARLLLAGLHASQTHQALLCMGGWAVVLVEMHVLLQASTARRAGTAWPREGGSHARIRCTRCSRSRSSTA